MFGGGKKSLLVEVPILRTFTKRDFYHIKWITGFLFTFVLFYLDLPGKVFQSLQMKMERTVHLAVKPRPGQLQ